MKIGIWSDTVGFPSLPLMKLSAYHKSLGDTVEFIQEGGHYDKAYLSKVFNLPTVRKIPTSPPHFTLMKWKGEGLDMRLILSMVLRFSEKNDTSISLRR